MVVSDPKGGDGIIYGLGGFCLYNLVTYLVIQREGRGCGCSVIGVESSRTVAVHGG